MSAKTVSEVAENYFNTLNPIAERISNDIDGIKEAYEDLWQCLSNRERDQIINETVIYPEAILKYALSTKSCGNTGLNNLVTGAKYIVDENTGSSWRDEHSAPFSWKTPSQIDLRVFGSSKVNSPVKTNSTSIINAKNNLNKNLFNESQNILDYSTATKYENGANSHDESLSNGKVDGWGKKLVAERAFKKRSVDTPDSPNLVIGGTSSKISGLCSKLKFLPGKSCSYEVKTVVSYSANSNDGNLLGKIKANTVLKIQNTIRLVGGKNFISVEKKSVNDVAESETLVQSKGAVIITKLQKPSPKVAKPKSPPPPPPVVKPAQTAKQETNGIEPGRIILAKNDSLEKDFEKVALLEENSMNSFPSTENGSLEFEREELNKVVHDISDMSITTDCTPLSGLSGDTIPKSGFDFLDNW